MKVLEANVTDKVDVRHLSDVQLARLGIRLESREEVVLQCVSCGETWEPLLDADGKLPWGYWICPAKCNQ